MSGLRGVTRPRLFEASFSALQMRLFALDTLGEPGWLKALRLGDYAPRRSRQPWSPALQEALFSYQQAWD
jgi:hypothetical protein